MDAIQQEESHARSRVGEDMEVFSRQRLFALHLLTTKAGVVDVTARCIAMTVLDLLLLPLHYCRGDAAGSLQGVDPLGPSPAQRFLQGTSSKKKRKHARPVLMQNRSIESGFSIFDDGLSMSQPALCEFVIECLQSAITNSPTSFPLLQLGPYFHDLLRIYDRKNDAGEVNIPSSSGDHGVFGDLLFFEYLLKGDEASINTPQGKTQVDTPHRHSLLRDLASWLGPHHNKALRPNCLTNTNHTNTKCSLLEVLSKSRLKSHSHSRKKSSGEELQAFLVKSLMDLESLKIEGAGGARVMCAQGEEEEDGGLSVIPACCVLLHSRERYPWLAVLSGDDDQEAALRRMPDVSEGVKEWCHGLPPQMLGRGFRVDRERGTHSYIIKSNDDARQEHLAVQLIQIVNSALMEVEFSLFLEPLTTPTSDSDKKQSTRKKRKKSLSPDEEDISDHHANKNKGEIVTFTGLQVPNYAIEVYRMVPQEQDSTAKLGREGAHEFGAVIEVVTEACSLHEIRRSLREEAAVDDHRGNKMDPEDVSAEFQNLLCGPQFFGVYPTPASVGSSSPSSSLNNERQINCLKSLLSSAIVSYVLRLRDRHNANVLLSARGELVNVDFGFFLQRAPGGDTFSVECEGFRLLEDFSNIFFRGSDKRCRGWQMFRAAFIKGVKAVRGSAFNEISSFFYRLQKGAVWDKLLCTNGLSVEEVLDQLSERLIQPSDEELADICDDALCHSGSAKYDKYQWRTNNIR